MYKSKLVSILIAIILSAVAWGAAFAQTGTTPIPVSPLYIPVVVSVRADTTISLYDVANMWDRSRYGDDCTGPTDPERSILIGSVNTQCYHASEGHTTVTVYTLEQYNRHVDSWEGTACGYHASVNSACSITEEGYMVKVWSHSDNVDVEAIALNISRSNELLPTPTPTVTSQPTATPLPTPTPTPTIPVDILEDFSQPEHDCRTVGYVQTCEVWDRQYKLTAGASAPIGWEKVDACYCDFDTYVNGPVGEGQMIIIKTHRGITFRIDTQYTGSDLADAVDTIDRLEVWVSFVLTYPDRE